MKTRVLEVPDQLGYFQVRGRLDPWNLVRLGSQQPFVARATSAGRVPLTPFRAVWLVERFTWLAYTLLQHESVVTEELLFSYVITKSAASFGSLEETWEKFLKNTGAFRVFCLRGTNTHGATTTQIRVSWKAENPHSLTFFGEGSSEFVSELYAQMFPCSVEGFDVQLGAGSLWNQGSVNIPAAPKRTWLQRYFI